MKKRVVVSVHGGLGNQIFQFALATELAKNFEVSLSEWKTLTRLDGGGKPWISQYEESRKFPWTESRGDLFFLAYARFCYKIKNASAMNSKFAKIYNFAGKFLISVPSIFQIRIITSVELGTFDIPQLRRRNYIFAYYQSAKLISNVKESLTRQNEIRLSKMGRDNPKNTGKRIAVIHIRRTDYAENPNFGLLKSNYFERSISYLRTVFHWDEIWLFSDDLHEALGLLPQSIANEVKVVSLKNETPLETLALMACGSAFILSNSSFGWWAANLSYQEPNLVIVPESWFKNLPEPKGLIPQNWIRVDAW